MASEYYKWLARDVKPEEEKELTKAEKRRNWWAYHKWQVIVTAVCLLFFGNLVYDAVDNYRNTPDYYIAYVGSTALPVDTAAAIEEAFAAVGEDVTGNGKVQVRLQQYSVSYADPTEDVVTDTSSYAGTVQLIADLESAQSVIFLLEDPEAFQASIGVLARIDGTLPENTPDSAVPLALRWADCPVLAAMDLGEYQPDGLATMSQGSSSERMADVYIARRGFWKDEAGEEIDGALALFALLTEGAITP